jgi:hypothetical protein
MKEICIFVRKLEKKPTSYMWQNMYCVFHKVPCCYDKEVQFVILLIISLPTLTSVGHQWTVCINTDYIQWLSLAKRTLKTAHAEKNYSLVARTIKWVGYMWHLNNTTIFLFPKRVILKREDCTKGSLNFCIKTWWGIYCSCKLVNAASNSTIHQSSPTHFSSKVNERHHISSRVFSLSSVPSFINAKRQGQ